jgi:hypothetical protein
MERDEILKYRRNIYSQNGEDGVLDFLLNTFGISDGTFCEFGAWDGKHLSNTYFLLEQRNWSGVYIEGDRERYLELEKLNNIFNDRIQTIESMVEPSGENTLDNILKKTKLEKNFDLLSIDIDGLDYLIWKSLELYRPKIVIIEVNSSFIPGVENPPNNGDFSNGCSFDVVCKLGLEKGYYPLVHFGNVFLADKEFLDSKNFPINMDINSLYLPLEKVIYW